jgi:coatomer protein complex subunit gamma
MSYSKKDEDGDQALMKVDRTSVFQEGEDELNPSNPPRAPL